MQKRCIIFDMDGVIIDSEPIHHACEKEIFDLLGIHVPEEVHNTFVGSTDEIMWSRIAEEHGLPMDEVESIIQLKQRLYLEYLEQEQYLQPIPNIMELIEELNNNFLLVLASSSPHEQIDYILENLDLKQYFTSIISGEDVVKGKPSPEIFLLAAKSAGVKPELCVVIEDSYNGIIAAKNARMKCIAYYNPNSGNQDLSKADIVVSSFKEISVAMLL
ncbi:MAG: HAD family hydrolase [Paludibacter sp.]|nr:HAD family hydrolase [Paludibacter sp.]